VSLKILRKALLFQRAFSKKKIYENLISKLLQNALQIDKSFWFSQNSKMTSKGTLFSNQNYFKLLPYLTKRKDFILG